MLKISYLVTTTYRFLPLLSYVEPIFGKILSPNSQSVNQKTPTNSGCSLSLWKLVQSSPMHFYLFTLCLHQLSDNGLPSAFKVWTLFWELGHCYEHFLCDTWAQK